MAYVAPRSLDDALAAMAAPKARAIMGGTDFYPALGRASPPGDVIDLSGIEELRAIRTTRRGLRIGAGATWDDVARASLPLAFDALGAAARTIGSIQIQNAATLVGNLCNASPAADGVPPLLVLDAGVEIAGSAGRRRLGLDAFLLGPRRTALGPGELVVAVEIPTPPAGAASAFEKLGSRAYMVISVVMVAALVRADREGRIAEARVAVGAASPVARRLAAVEGAVVGRRADDIIEALEPERFDALAPIDDVRAGAAYRRDAAAELCRRALVRALAAAESARP